MNCIFFQYHNQTFLYLCSYIMFKYHIKFYSCTFYWQCLFYFYIFWKLSVVESRYVRRHVMSTVTICPPLFWGEKVQFLSAPPPLNAHYLFEVSIMTWTIDICRYMIVTDLYFLIFRYRVELSSSSFIGLNSKEILIKKFNERV